MLRVSTFAQSRHSVDVSTHVTYSSAMVTLIYTIFRVLFRLKEIEDTDTGEQQEQEVECSEEEFRGSQQSFQECSHGVTSRTNDDLSVSVTKDAAALPALLCAAVSDVTVNCVPLLAKCLNPTDVAVLSK